jgi:HK97 family phage major capsid protein
MPEGRIGCPGILDSVPRYSTNQVPTNLTQGSANTASDIFVGDWSQLYVGVHTELIITVLRERYADTGEIGLVAWWRGDVMQARDTAFRTLVGVL